jgi:hypothetical protein
VIPFPLIQFFRVESIDSLHQLMKDIGGIYWHIFLPFLALGIFLSARNNEYHAVACFGFMLLGMAISGWLDPRWRLMGMVPAYVLIAQGVQYIIIKNNETKKNKNKFKFFCAIYYTLICLGSLIY